VQIKVWIRELHTIVGPDIIIAIAGNKVDEEKRRAVNREAAEEYARSVGAIHVLTSAKMNKGIDAIFNELVTRTCV
jgi:Ras-related protein Rab-21